MLEVGLRSSFPFVVFLDHQGKREYKLSINGAWRFDPKVAELELVPEDFHDGILITLLDGLYVDKANINDQGSLIIEFDKYCLLVDSSTEGDVIEPWILDFISKEIICLGGTNFHPSNDNHNS